MIIEETKIHLQYRKSTSGYWKKDYMPFLDNPSGGYPYETDISNAYSFKSVTAAEDYGRGEFDVRIVKITYEY